MLIVFSYGGGVQSTAALVLAAEGRIPYHTFLFCNVGEDSENPETLTYVREVARPFAERVGLAFHELARTRRDGTTETLYGRLTRPGSRSIGIPVRMASGAPGRRACTIDFKIAVCDRWLVERGATKEGATVGLGISLDEWQRMRSDSGKPWKRLAYPLIDLRLDRAACLTVIARAGLRAPPKSSCWFCPYHSLRRWQAMREREPVLFARAVALERLINERRAMLGRDAVWLSDGGKPLDQVTTAYQQASLFDEDEPPCESGFCFT
jgi:hypothetical protein